VCKSLRSDASVGYRYCKLLYQLYGHLDRLGRCDYATFRFIIRRNGRDGMSDLIRDIVHMVKRMMADNDAMAWVEFYMDIHRYYMENWNFWRDNIGFCLGK
jgi:hypothetical protein